METIPSPRHENVFRVTGPCNLGIVEMFATLLAVPMGPNGRTSELYV